MTRDDSALKSRSCLVICYNYFMDLNQDFKYKTLPSFEKVKQIGKNIRVHPNGFIQLDLEDGYRLHFFLDDAAYERFPHTPIHTHAFVLESRVLLGEVTNIEFEVREDPQGSLSVYTAQNMESPLEKRVGKTYSISGKKEQVVGIGEEYRVRVGIFHESLHKGDTVTVVRKIKEGMDVSMSCEIDVLCKKEQEPSEAYDRKDIPEAVLWSKVGAVLENTTQKS